ncbi:MAG: hypothetical protein SGILL_007171 [Bacillariaceae sp.]
MQCCMHCRFLSSLFSVILQMAPLSVYESITMNKLEGEERVPLPGNEEQLEKTQGASKRKELSRLQEAWDKMNEKDVKELDPFEKLEAEQDITGSNVMADVAPQTLAQAGVAALDRELFQRQHSRHSPQNPEALILATVASSQMFRDEAFRLMFARADRLHPEKAASRMSAFFSLGLELYGQQALVRPVRPSDFETADEEALKNGWIQISMTRDRAGRRIVVMDDLGPETLSIRNKCAAADLDTQTKGVQLVIQIFNPDKSPFLSDPASREQIRRLLACSPVRFSCVHFCFPTLPSEGDPDSKMPAAAKDGERAEATTSNSDTLNISTITKAAASLLGKDERIRTKFHTGSIIECHEQLGEYGFSPDVIPMTSTGRVKLKEHEKWIMIQVGKARAKQHGQPFSIVECPTKQHILLVKGRHIARHEGNMRLRSILQDRYDERNTSSRARKIAITAEVMDALLEEGYTFLVKNHGDFWVTPPRKTVLEKLAIAFRTVPRLKPLNS